MINLTRRGFLTSALAASAIVAAPVPFQISRRPHLWGDGIHDDTEALQWLIDQAEALRRPLRLKGGRFRTTATLIIKSHADIEFGEWVIDHPGHALLIGSHNILDVREVSFGPRAGSNPTIVIGPLDGGWK